MTPSISIIMPCFNALVHLPRSIDSVLSQTFTDWELIAVDDGSSDGTLEWFQSQTDKRISFYSQYNRGVSAARNTGLTFVRGDYVAFLDADDTWGSDFLKILFEMLISNPDAVLAYCGWQNVGLSGPHGEPFIPPDYETPSKREDLFSGCRWPIHAALSKRNAVISSGGFNENLKNAEDYLLWLEMAGTSPIIRVPEILAYYHFHGDAQASGNHALAALHFLSAQQGYLSKHPDFYAQLGYRRRRELLYGNLIQRGYDVYWKHDLPSARTLFRRVMRSGYGHANDWKHMLPSLLPLQIHEALIRLMDHC